MSEKRKRSSRQCHVCKKVIEKRAYKVYKNPTRPVCSAYCYGSFRRCHECNANRIVGEATFLPCSRGCHYWYCTNENADDTCYRRHFCYGDRTRLYSGHLRKCARCNDFNKPDFTTSDAECGFCGLYHDNHQIVQIFLCITYN